MDSDTSWPAGPAELVRLLTDWASDTAWVEWLELGGSLGRGGGDRRSDVDAGIGTTDKPGDRLSAVEQAVARFATTAAVLRQPFGPRSTHLLTVYTDGRQLSLVVMPARDRAGLPPQARPLVDKADRLAIPLSRETWDPDSAERRETTFLACIAAGDALKHSARGSMWRALHSLNEARDRYLQLLAAQERVTFPQFGAVSLENDGRTLPTRLTDTLVGTLDAASIDHAVTALVGLLQPFVIEHQLRELTLALDLPAAVTTAAVRGRL